ncbi:flagellar basal body rod C-terminal domain-containing protein [Gilvimarinus chinensis]|uniref:flagellar basal body rod C-terminal domain-containing protein n=1 Tax=Gilvimarinus chinensis TaxID=396005 RepID=UPI00037B0FD7|nr:flagellar basal body rod C-terminal domain-containing protein [Gilvimarinus chinensis]
MDVGSVVNQSLIGLHSSRAEIVKSAEQISQVAAGDTSQGIVEPLVNMQQSQQVFDSSAKVLETANETLGTLLDIKA